MQDLYQHGLPKHIQEDLINDDAFKTWRSEGLKVTYDPFPYDFGLKTRAWPVA